VRAPLDLPLLVPGLRLDRDAPAERARALRRAEAPWVAGFCLFGGHADEVADLCAALRAAAGRPLFVASDMERGAGQQVDGLARLPDLGLVGAAGTEADAFAHGERTARDARGVGVDVLFAPVLDTRSEPRNPIVGMRSFGHDPARVARLGVAWARGALAGGALPVAKHFPGHGATSADSHDERPVVLDDAARLRARDLAPFLAYADAIDPPAFMTAHVAYPSLDPSGEIATFSSALIGEARRAAPRLVVFSDALLMQGALGAGGEPEAARRALAAGCDALLYPDSPETVAERLLADAPDALREAAARAAQRLLAFAVRAAEARPTEAHPTEAGASASFAAALAARAVAAAGGLWREEHALLVLDDDGMEGRGLVLLDRARRAGVDARLERPPQVHAAAGAEAPRASRTVVVFASPRAWKGCAGASAPLCARLDGLRAAAAGRGERLRVVLCASDGEADARLEGTGPDLEAAIADRLFAGDARE
jgi:beta-glucosidase-like glycosyl hydrolase